VKEHLPDIDDVSRSNLSRVCYLIGTGTGVGKTLLTCLLTLHFRDRGVSVKAVKPFCSGGSLDARQLRAVQAGSIQSLNEISPFRYRRPLAPQAAARPGQAVVTAAQVERFLVTSLRGNERLLVEGCGGLLTPLAAGQSTLDWLRRVPGEVIVIGWNRLGVLNELLLTESALRGAGIEQGTVVLMTERRPDLSSASNPEILRTWLPGWRLFELPFMTGKHGNLSHLKGLSKKFEKTLANVCCFDSFSPLFEDRTASKRPPKKSFASGVDNAAE